MVGCRSYTYPSIHLFMSCDASRNFELKVVQNEACITFCTLTFNSKATHRVSLLHHGDDFLIFGTRADVKEMTEQISAIFIVKVRGTLGPRHGSPLRGWIDGKTRNELPSVWESNNRVVFETAEGGSQFFSTASLFT